ncbi:MAG: hypothetical protein JRE58_13530 [Deltaproteobacteria bacterium]|nr:hypothetical protein [Deltaproteobacteria bacterium]
MPGFASHGNFRKAYGNFKIIAGVEFVEPDVEKICRWSNCCGRRYLETSHSLLSERMGKQRFKKLQKTDANVIVTNCQTC